MYVFTTSTVVLTMLKTVKARKRLLLVGNNRPKTTILRYLHSLTQFISPFPEECMKWELFKRTCFVMSLLLTRVMVISKICIRRPDAHNQVWFSKKKIRLWVDY